MFGEFDVVRLRRGAEAGAFEHWPGAGSGQLQAGAHGAVVMVYEREAGEPQRYEVEFVGPDGLTIALLTLSESDIEAV